MVPPPRRCRPHRSLLLRLAYFTDFSHLPAAVGSYSYAAWRLIRGEQSGPGNTGRMFPGV